MPRLENVHVDDADVSTAAQRRLADEVEQLLRRSGYLELHRLKATANAHEIVLEGAVHTYHLKQVAQTMIQPMAGTRRIRNNVEVI